MSVFDHVSGRLSALDQRVLAAVPPGGNWRDLPEDFPSARVAQIRRGAQDGKGSRSTYYGRMHPDRPAYTVSTYFNRPGNGCFIHPFADRLITIREAARLQGFPDSFRFTGRGRSRLIQVGNAVPPLLAYQLARCVPGTRTVDLFSGAGGLTLGFAWAGFQTIAAVDRDVAAIEALDGSLQEGVGIVADLSQPAEMARMLREVRRRAGSEGTDVLIGGPPCQGFSTAGKWLATDARNDLMFAFVEAVERLRPRSVVMENVAALLWRRGRPFLEDVRRRLHNIGYSTAVGLLHTETYGLPQLRRRLILLAGRDGEIAWPAPICALADPAYPEYQPRAGDHLELPPAPTVLQAIGDLPITTAEDPDEELDYESGAQTCYQRWARGETSIEDLIGRREPLPIHGQMTLAEAIHGQGTLAEGIHGQGALAEGIHGQGALAEGIHGQGTLAEGKMAPAEGLV